MVIVVVPGLFFMAGYEKYVTITDNYNLFNRKKAQLVYVPSERESAEKTSGHAS